MGLPVPTLMDYINISMPTLNSITQRLGKAKKLSGMGLV